MIGQTISHYKILEKLGEGGMGVVYKAHDSELDRDVALKFLPNYLASDTAERERFYHEARAASALNHPNITTIYEIGRAEDHLFIAMECVEGKTLKYLVDKDSISLNKVLEFAIQICEGLALAAEKGVVHRDIKSDNIMVTPKGQVKIMDFGLAMLKGASRLTKAGSTLGTAAYMSPEQAQGEEVDQRSDIFSFGVVLYEMLTSNLPFKGEHQSALIYSLINEDPPPIARFNDKVTPELEHITVKSLAKLREDRYQHIDEMLADLRRERKQIEYARTGYVKASMAATTATQPGRPRKRLIQYLMLATGVILVTVLVSVFNPFNFQISMQKSAAAGKNSLAVLYFQNEADPIDKDHIGDMLTNLLITSLSQSRDLEVISRERLFDILKELGQADATSITPTVATEVSKRAGVSTMLTGIIHQTQPNLIVTTNLIEVESGKIVGSQRLTSFSSGQIFNLVDSLALLIRKDFRISSIPAKSKPVAEVTTKSPEAYRFFIEGVNLYWRFSYKEAKVALERAVELDNQFAMAYFVLGATHYSLGEREAARTSAQKALEFSANVTERERLEIHSGYYLFEDRYLKAAQFAEQLVEKYPHEVPGYVMLAMSYQYLAEQQKRTDVLRNGVRIIPSSKELWNDLSYRLAESGERQDAMDAVNEYVRLAPSEPNPYDTKGDIFQMFGEYDSSRAWYLKSNALRRDYSANKLAYDAIVRRDYETAAQYFQITSDARPFIEIHRGQFKLARTKAGKSVPRIIHLVYEIGEHAEMLRLATDRTAELKQNPPDKIYGRDYLAWAYAVNKNFAQAYKLVDEIRNDFDPELPMMQVTVDYTCALIAYEEEKYALALENFQKVYDRLFPNHAPNLFYAVSLVKSSKHSDALRELHRLSEWYPQPGGSSMLASNPGSELYWPISQVKAHYWLGVLHEQLGEKDNAIREYETFLDIWKDADFKSVQMQNARARLARLKGVSMP